MPDIHGPTDAASDTPGKTAEDRRARLGVLLVLIAACFYGFGSPGARLAYDAGAEPIAVLAARLTLMTATLWLFLRLRGRRIPVPARQRVRLLALGTVFGCIGASYLTSVRFIPVSLAVLLFFTYPLLTLLIARVAYGTRITTLRIAAFAAAFLGIALALGVEAARLDLRGVGLALVASTCCALSLSFNARVRAGLDGPTSQFYMLLPGACVFLAVYILGGGGGGLPRGTTGWLGFAAAVASFLGGTFFFFASIPLAGTVRVALFGNLEPVVTLVAAAVVLGEALAPPQLAGAGLVVGSILLLPLVEKRHKKPLAPPDLVT